MSAEDDAFRWQVGVWDTISDAYQREIDARFAEVVEQCVAHARLQPGEHVLDLGTGTGAVAVLAADKVGPTGRVVAVDISPEMLASTRQRVTGLGLAHVDVVEGRGEAVPVPDASLDVLIASLSMMYVIDREAAARECARLLRPGGRFVAAVWAGPDDADIVRFQQVAGSFAPPPPVPGVGPGALADPSPFLDQLKQAGVAVEVVRTTAEFHFESFEQAWDVLAGVTTASLAPDRREEAKQAVRAAMWPDPEQPRRFVNGVQLLLGRRNEA